MSEYEVEIVDVNALDGGIEIFARAWKDGQQLGFGAGGTIDIERFRFWNPPVLVDDPLGDIVRPAKTFEVDKIDAPERRLREDPVEAIQNALVETISKTGVVSQNIIPNSRGNTTDTFYATVDARLTPANNSDWDTMIGAASAAGIASTNTTDYLFFLYYYAGDGGYLATRAFFTFDTAGTISSGNTISSATLSFYGSSKLNQQPLTIALNIYGGTPADPNSYATGDFDQIGNTAFSSDLAYADFNTAGYNDFTLNASGIAAIAKGTGYTVFATSEVNYDTANRISSGASNPTIGSDKRQNLNAYFADETGTTNDPKLVVVHTAGASTSIKTVNGLAIASVKTVNGLAIASVKTINGLA